MDKIDELSYEFITGALSSESVIEKEKKELVRIINNQILIYYKINPKSKLEQLMHFNQNFQKVLHNQMDFPDIPNRKFKMGEHMFKQNSD